MRSRKILVLNRSDTLAEQLRGVCDDLRPRVEIVVCERVGAVGDVLEHRGPFDVLVAGPSLGTRSGLARLEIIHDELPALNIVLAFARRPDASLRDIVRTGAVDLLQLPADDKTLLESIERALELAARTAPGGEALAAMAPPSAAPAGPGRVFTVTSATGGCGKTFFSTNLAYFLSKFGNRRACIVDLDLQFGEIATALRLRPRYTIFDALERADADDEDLNAHIEEFLVTHDTGISVLAAPKIPEEADRIDPPDVTRIIEALRSRFDAVIIDTPTALTEVVLAALDLSDTLYVMGTLDLPSVRNMSVFLGTLEKLRIPSDNIRLILNKAESDVGIELHQVEKLFPKGFEAVLPYAKEVHRSINTGQPVLASVPDADISRRMAQGLRPLLPAELQARVPDAPESAGGIRRLFRRMR